MSPASSAAAIGGYLGYLAVGFIMGYGFWVPILPGAFAGLACGQLSTSRSWPRGVVNGLVALGSRSTPSSSSGTPRSRFDGTFGGYLPHVHELPILTLIVLVVNGLLAAWWGREERMGLGPDQAEAAGRGLTVTRPRRDVLADRRRHRLAATGKDLVGGLAGAGADDLDLGMARLAGQAGPGRGFRDSVGIGIGSGEG